MSDKKVTVVVVDTETTGTSIKQDGICQVSAVLVQFQGRKVVGRPTTLVNTRCRPHIPIPEEASQVHGVYDKDVIYATPQKWALMQLDMVLRSMGGPENIVVAGHNSEQFDCRLMDRIFPNGEFGSYRHIDTMMAGRRLFPTGRHKLGEMYTDLLGKDPDGAHDAAFDCHMVAQIIQFLVEKDYFPGKDLEEIAQWMMVPYVYDVMPMGKFKGRPIHEVPRPYLRWMDRTWDFKDRDVQATINHALSGTKEAANA